LPEIRCRQGTLQERAEWLDFRGYIRPRSEFGYQALDLSLGTKARSREKVGLIVGGEMRSE
jgi:hypothetical protein